MKKNYLYWGNGGTSLFLEEDGSSGEYRLLDYEFDHEEIHKRCGGTVTYVSNSGLSGEGYVFGYSDLIKVGYYRVDTRFFWDYCPEEVGIIPGYPKLEQKNVKVMLPYEAHTGNKKVALNSHPVVVMVGNATVIYCRYCNLKKTLENVFEENIEYNVLKRTFVDLPYMREEDVELKFKNFFGKGPYPWVFAKKILEMSEVHRQCGEEYLDAEFKMYRRNWAGGWNFVRTERIDGIEYAVELLLTGGHDPLDFTSRHFNPEVSIFAEEQWKEVCHNDNIVVMADGRTNTVKLIGWSKTAVTYPKRVERVKHLVPEQCRAILDDWCAVVCERSKYIAFEAEVPKVLWVSGRNRFIAKIKAGLAEKVAHDVRQVVENQLATEKER